jgi:hypothetical protein
MKQLETKFTQDNNNFTQVKRSDKAAVYRRETLEGAHVSFEVFAIRTKDEQEVYPNQKAMSRWAWCPVLEKDADKWYNRFNKGEIPIPQIDPITGENIPLTNDISLDELMAQTDVPVSVLVETPATQEDPTIPNEAPVDVVVSGGGTPVESVPAVLPTPDGGAVVTVAKVKKAKAVKAVKVASVLTIPTGEFTQAQFATANGMPERGSVWGKINGLVEAGKLNKVMRQVGKGRPTAFFTAKV